MGYLQNGYYLNAEPIKQFGGGSAAICETRAGWNHPERAYNFMFSVADTYDSGSHSLMLKAGYPNGYAPPYNITMPIKDGGMSCYRGILPSGTVASTSNMLSVNECIAIITASGSISSSSLLLKIYLAATVASNGSISSADMVGVVYMASAITALGEISISTALDIIAWMASTLTGSGNADGSTAEGTAFMDADIYVNTSQATSAQIANAVWTSLMEAGLTAEQALRLLTAIAVGKTTIDTSGPVVVTFRDINDTKNRVVGTMSGSERVSVTTDVT